MADLDVSRSVEPRSVQVRSMTVCACRDSDYSLPVKSAIKDKELKLVELVELVRGRTSERNMFGTATPDEKELSRVALSGAAQPVLSLPMNVKDLQARLMVCVDIGNEH